MPEPRPQDERTWVDHSSSDPVSPPAPANQWTPHDGGIEPSAPSPDSTRGALTRLVNLFRRFKPAAK